jgi:dihydrofolate synthase/folylpolyglutamate synthase
MYTSPHLSSITERVQIDGASISEDKFAELATQVRDTSEGLASSGVIDNIPTFFEQVTAIALLAFAEANVELAILETGLGGRLDATTAANAEIAAITRIDYDHQQYLGETIEEIAAEKAAIIHPGCRVVALRQSREVDAVINGRCREVGVEPGWATENILAKPERDVRPGLIATFVTERSGYGNVLLWNMVGKHQLENAAVAIGVAEVLGDLGFKIGSKAIEIGLETAEHPGRLEWIDGFLLDGAHNIGGARALREFLDEYVDRRITMVFGAMKEKDITPIASILFSVADRLVLTTPHNTRAIAAGDLLAFVPDGFDMEHVFVEPTVRIAIETARRISSEGTPIIVTGSLYLIGEVRELLLSNSRI